MTPDEYLEASARTAQPSFDKVQERLAEPGAHELHQAVIGMVKESSELLDEMYRWLFYGKSMSRAHLVKELGDCQWYHAQAIRALNSSYEEVWGVNVAKLQARYGTEFSEARAVNRDIPAETAATIVRRCRACGMTEPSEVTSGGCVRGRAHIFGDKP